MTNPAVLDDPARLAALQQSGLLFSPAEERFDRITRLASHILDTPIALVSLVSDTRQWFKSAQGLEAAETPREMAFCAHAIVDGTRLVVEDATADDRFRDNPLVLGPPGVRAYAGNVIRSESGHALGTLCVVDSKPRQFSEEVLARLADLAAIAQAEIRRTAPGLASGYLRKMDERAREERLDVETRTLSHDAMVELLLEEAAAAEAAGEELGIVLVRVGSLDRIAAGGEGTSAVLREAAAAMRRALGEDSAVGRYDRQTFLAVTRGTDVEVMAEGVTRVRAALAEKPIQVGRLAVRLPANVAAACRAPGQSLSQLLESTAEYLG